MGGVRSAQEVGLVTLGNRPRDWFSHELCFCGARIRLAAAVFLTGLLSVGCKSDADEGERFAPVDLRVELLRGDEVTISSYQVPRFSWRQPDGDRLVQSAYRIQVASRDETGSTSLIWDSGVVQSAQAHGVRYLGPSLAAERWYQWTVQVWGRDGKGSHVSRPQRFFVSGGVDAMPPRLPLVSTLVEPTEIVEAGDGRRFFAFPSVAYAVPVIEFVAFHPPGGLLVEVGEHRVGDSLWRSSADGFFPESNIFYYGRPLHTEGAIGRFRLEFPASPVGGATDFPDGIGAIRRSAMSR